MSHPFRIGPVERPSPAESPRTIEFEVFRSLESLEAVRPQLEQLALEAVEPNPFYEPWLLFPALRAFFADPGVLLRFVLVWRRRGGEASLLGFFPMEIVRGVRSVPLRTARLLQHPHAFLPTPLVRRGEEREALLGWLRWAKGALDRFDLLALEGCAAEGPIHRALMQALAEEGLAFSVRDGHARAVFRPADDAERYLREALGGKRCKELRRQERRMEEEGGHRFRALIGPVAAEAWIERFLQLEAAGWKGIDGGAFLSRPEDARFFREAARDGLRMGRLRMLGLEHRGELVAINVNLLAGHGGFAFKTAYDERLARFAPGLLLEVENLRRLHRDPDVRWLDSCALPENETANRLFSGRRLFHTLLIGLRPFPGGLAVSALPLLRWGRRTATAALQRLQRFQRGER